MLVLQRFLRNKMAKRKKIKIEWVVFWITLAIIVGGIIWVLLAH